MIMIKSLAELRAKRKQLQQDMDRVLTREAKWAIEREIQRLEDQLLLLESSVWNSVGVYSLDPMMRALAHGDTEDVRRERAKLPCGLASLTNL